jgi:hypothetical protein
MPISSPAGAIKRKSCLVRGQRYKQIEPPPKLERGCSFSRTLFADVDNEVFDALTPRPVKKFRFSSDTRGSSSGADGDAGSPAPARAPLNCGALSADEMVMPALPLERCSSVMTNLPDVCVDDLPDF